MKKLVALAVVSAFFIQQATAQLRFGPEVGLNLSTVKYKVGGEDISSGMKPGVHLGAIADIPLTSHLYLQPGIMFYMLNSKETIDILGVSSDEDITLNYVRVPVTILYKLGEAGGGRFMFGLSPYVGFAVSGKMKGDGESEDIKFGSDETEDDMKSLDVGLGLQVGYELPMGLWFGAGYQLGLTNNLPGGDADNKVNNSNVIVTLGYLFGGRK